MPAAASGGVRVALSNAVPRPATLHDPNTDDRPILEFLDARSYVAGPAWAMAPADASLLDSPSR